MENNLLLQIVLHCHFIAKELKVQIEEKACAVMTWENWDINITGKILNNKPVQGVL